MSDIDWDLLFRYLGRECTPDESARVERWISADARHRAILESARVAADRVLAAAPVHLTSPRFTMARGDQRRSSWAVAAAACLIAVFGATLIWRTLGPVDRANRAPVMRTIATHEGERDTLRLDDGTRVVLGAASTLHYPATFGSGPREVYLVGEGYFEVSHDSRRPFRVRAGSAIAEDLGTAFDMRAYAGDSAVRVVVTEGKVALGAATSGVVQGAILEPGQLGRLTKGKTVPSVQRVDVATYLGWMQGRLAFDDALLGDVVTELARWYRMEFRIVDSSVATRRLSGSFTNTSLPELLGTLAPVLDVRFERIGDTVLVRRSRSSP